MGATTIWERWDSMLPDGSINPGEMTSFNHYALGAVADWLHRVVGGISMLEPGYKKILIAPQPGGTITSAATSLESPCGPISVEWELRDDVFTSEISIPEHTTALVRLPSGVEHHIEAGRYAIFGEAITEITPQK